MKVTSTLQKQSIGIALTLILSVGSLASLKLWAETRGPNNRDSGLVVLSENLSGKEGDTDNRVLVLGMKRPGMTQNDGLFRTSESALGMGYSTAEDIDPLFLVFVNRQGPQTVHSFDLSQFNRKSAHVAPKFKGTELEDYLKNPEKYAGLPPKVVDVASPRSGIVSMVLHELVIRAISLTSGAAVSRLFIHSFYETENRRKNQGDFLAEMLAHGRGSSALEPLREHLTDAQIEELRTALRYRFSKDGFWNGVLQNSKKRMQKLEKKERALELARVQRMERILTLAEQEGLNVVPLGHRFAVVRVDLDQKFEPRLDRKLIQWDALEKLKEHFKARVEPSADGRRWIAVRVLDVDDFNSGNDFEPLLRLDELERQMRSTRYFNNFKTARGVVYSLIPPFIGAGLTYGEKGISVVVSAYAEESAEFVLKRIDSAAARKATRLLEYQFQELGELRAIFELGLVTDDQIPSFSMGILDYLDTKFTPTEREHFRSEFASKDPKRRHAASKALLARFMIQAENEQYSLNFMKHSEYLENKAIATSRLRNWLDPSRRWVACGRWQTCRDKQIKWLEKRAASGSSSDRKLP